MTATTNSQPIERNIAMELVRVTEAAAMAAIERLKTSRRNRSGIGSPRFAKWRATSIGRLR